MMPIGPLMIEHRLVERLIALIREEQGAMKEQDKARICFIDGALDFLKTYADRGHHGKEEGILFKELEKKQLSPEHRTILEELKKEHGKARNTVNNLAKARDSYAKGDANALKDILEGFENLLDLYPQHIQKEDKRFFIPSMSYLSKDEQADMLQRFWDFDKRLIHEKYREVVQQLPACKD